MSRDESGSASLGRAFDAARFGPTRTLNLRAQQPTAAQAATQTEAWLRTLQVQGANEALVVTGRGNQSIDGYSPVREAIVRLLPSLRRRNVISGFAEHTPGSFVVTMAPVRALFEAPSRRREKAPRTERAAPAELAALDDETVRQLRDLARLALAQLGLKAPTHAQLQDEMHRQFAALTTALPADGDREALLQQAMQRAAEEYEAD
ncbi:MAG: hypothetical protein IPP90_08975 [Gemmatimonadaceae bacterium]|nr:hypothetical protein [Gemmatimonadaceae bacterium]